MKKTLTIALSAAALTLALAACGSSPKTQAPSYVGMDAAKNAALADAGVSTTNAVFTTAELDDKNGTAYYDLKFSDGTAEYEYDVDALTGVVIEGKKDDTLRNNGIVNSGSGNAADISTTATSTSTGTTTGTSIDENKAKSIALADAGVKEADTSYLVVKPDFDNGVAVYDVEFYVASTKLEYDYEIDAATGDIRSMDQDIEGYTPSGSTTSNGTAAGTTSGGTTSGTTSGSTTTGASTGTDIGETKAKSIALTNAGVKEADTGYLRVKLDYDDGIKVYEVEFYAGGIEYDYEINAATGEIRSMDHDAEGYTAPQTGSAKSEADIQAIALAKVPGATASNLRMHLDFDDGRQTYEGSIYYNSMEYEFTIDAYSGAILEWESESIYD
ncbi:PepSY domain-containing protein [Candidatus Avoscillospira sp. LCP25S3_F1]|uniref:PepSY domain-containing protein n=1 Tax=Candidatus Avoscillospira sp. LCP25S3_F1 TaxID=3438825 RepID=UPI003F938370